MFLERRCTNWLRVYRLRLSAKDGCTALYKLSLHDLHYWYHVEKLSPSQLQERYLNEHGVHADRAHLVSWMKAPGQALSILENNEVIHSHACGEYVLQELQSGIRPEKVVEQLLCRYLVITTKERVAAYRYYREQRSEYWTQDKLERLCWEVLYGLVTLETNLVLIKRGYSKRFEKRLIEKRIEFCRSASLAEELVPLKSLQDFFRRHMAYARLPLQFPEATVYKDALPWTLVEAYRRTFARQKLPESAFACMAQGAHGPSWRARTVAVDSGYVAQPRACASACVVASYAMLKCEELFPKQCWYQSMLTAAQRVLPAKYPVEDFKFWDKYGSWSRCPHCGVMFFNDKYFRESVYQDRQTSATPDLLSTARRMEPTDPLEHSHGKVGVSSRWWYLDGMFKMEFQCGSCTKRPKVKKAEDAEGVCLGKFFAESLRRRQEKYAAAGQRSAQGCAGQDEVKSGELYMVPCVDVASKKDMALECFFWPRYRLGSFVLFGTDGDCMLDLTEVEHRALNIVVLRTSYKAERYGAAHHINWKKVD